MNSNESLSRLRLNAEPQSAPLVSVGVPVYNGGAELGRALDSLLAQTHANLEIIVCDNCSTDGTESLCRKYAAADARIDYRRNEANIGGAPNFVRVLDLARGEYFMWAAHDDWHAPDFVAANLRNLLAHPDYVASMSGVEYRRGGSKLWMPFIHRADTRALIGSVAANVRHFVANSGMNSRFYGLFRRAVLLKCLPFEVYTGSDNALMVRTMAYGKHGEVRRPLFFRGMAGESANHLRMLTADRSLIGRFVPLLQYSRRVWRMPHVKREIGLLISLITVNCVFCAMLLIALIRDAVVKRSPSRKRRE